MITSTLKIKYEGSASRIIKLWEDSTNTKLQEKNITGLNLTKFVKHLEKNLAPSSARQYAARVKSVLNTIKDDIKLPSAYASILSLKATKNVSTYLSVEDIDKFAAYEPKDNNEMAVWALFLLECYTGARTSDCIRMQVGNIVNGNIDYVSKKTSTHAVVPCKPIVRKILEGELHKKATVCSATLEAIIERICKAVGIDGMTKVYQAGVEKIGHKYEFITSHSGRRSFATNLYLKGCNIYSISKMMGHSSITMTERYICVDIVELIPEVMAYFA